MRIVTSIYRLMIVWLQQMRRKGRRSLAVTVERGGESLNSYLIYNGAHKGHKGESLNSYLIDNGAHRVK